MLTCVGKQVPFRLRSASYPNHSMIVSIRQEHNGNQKENKTLPKKDLKSTVMRKDFEMKYLLVFLPSSSVKARLKHPIDKFPKEDIRDMILSVYADPQCQDCDERTKIELATYKLMKSKSFETEKVEKNSMKSECNKAKEAAYLEKFKSDINLPSVDVTNVQSFQNPIPSRGISHSLRSVPWYKTSSMGHLQARLLYAISKDDDKKVELKSAATLNAAALKRHFSTCTNLTFFHKTPAILKQYRIQQEISNYQIDIDSSFEPKEFLNGCKVALIAITQIIQSSDYSSLAGLFTQRAREKFINNVETKWSEVEKNNIFDITEDNLISAEIEKIFSHVVGFDRYVDITVKFHAEKPLLKPPMKMELLLVFSRKYSRGSLLDWTVSDFKLISVSS